MEKNSMPSLKDAARRNKEIDYSNDYRIEDEFLNIGNNKKYFIHLWR